MKKYWACPECKSKNLVRRSTCSGRDKEGKVCGCAQPASVQEAVEARRDRANPARLEPRRPLILSTVAREGEGFVVRFYDCTM